MNFSKQAYAHKLELHDAHHGYIEISRRTITPARRINYEGQALRETQTRNIHEMGEMKRAHKNWETHETIQRLTSQMQEMQEQVNSMNDSGEC